VSGSEVAPGVVAIDTLMTGRERMTCAYLVLGERSALVDTGPITSVRSVIQALDDLGIAPDGLADIVATHIHLDHSGGLGALADHFTSARIWVHERGAPHLADPQKLVASAERLYGKATLLRWFGSPQPADATRLHVAEDSAEIDLGQGKRLRFEHTPGHASHHIAVQETESGVVFSGDAVGVHLPDTTVIRPASPPPEFDPELAIASIERIRSIARGSIMFAHFGPASNVEETCDSAIEAIQRWTEVARQAPPGDSDSLAFSLAEADRPFVSGLDEEDLERLEILAGYRSDAIGLARYWTKRREREGDSGSESDSDHQSGSV
jgi:glyoxylase-like metal-dependent hydrolase (beta-lactamase superfamily II)